MSLVSTYMKPASLMRAGHSLSKLFTSVIGQYLAIRAGFSVSCGRRVVLCIHSERM
jgi:hypothetical protein